MGKNVNEQGSEIDMPYSIRWATETDHAYIETLLLLKQADIGYPRCDSLKEYLAELALYESELGDCTFVVLKNKTPIGIAGMLHCAADEEGYLWGPIFGEEESEKAVDCCVKEIIKKYTGRCNAFSTVISKQNLLLRNHFGHSAWLLKKSYLEMQYTMTGREGNIKPSAVRLGNDGDLKKRIVQFQKSEFAWQGAQVEELLSKGGFNSSIKKGRRGMLSPRCAL